MEKFSAWILGLITAFVVAGQAFADSHLAIIADAGKTNASSKSVRESIIRAGVNQLILPGDNLYSGSYQSVWTPWKNASLTFDVVAIGNHNGGYRQEMSFFSMPGEYYSKVIDGARFIVLNSDNAATGTAQAQWLSSELRNATERLIFLVYHHPSYTISSFHDWTEKAAFQRAVRPVIWANRSKITALLVGHDHLATLLHFNDLPVIVSGAIHEQRLDGGVDYMTDGVLVKTAWYFDRKPYWAHLSYQTNSNEARVEFVRATDDKIGCSFTVRAGSAANLDNNCSSR